MVSPLTTNTTSADEDVQQRILCFLVCHAHRPGGHSKPHVVKRNRGFGTYPVFARSPSVVSKASGQRRILGGAVIMSGVALLTACDLHQIRKRVRTFFSH